MTNSVIRTSARKVKGNFTLLQFCGSLIIAGLIICSYAPEAFAIPNPGTSLKRQYENYEREVEEPQTDAEADALTRVPGRLNNAQLGRIAKNRAKRLVNKLQSPVNTNKQAKAKTHAQANGVGNAAADIARDQAVTAIDYCSRFMKNFTTDGGNRWGRIRDQFFIPLAVLLILPGAVLTQVKALIAQSNPILGQASPLEGLERAIVTVFLVPATYLVTNYAIDVGNSIHHSVCSEYTRLMGSDMYRDAMCAEIRAFGVRYLSENEGSLNVPMPDLSPRGSEPFAEIEGTLWGKLADPCVGLYLVPPNRDDASMPQSSIAVRMGMYTANAGLCAGWACLTAFQMAFFYYLYLVGPIMAALWAWPMKTFKDALPNWVEGCVTLAFWSFFWQVTIAILALTKSPASTGLYMVTALNVLATCSVKHAFDFAGVMRSAVGQAEAIGAEVAANASGGGGGGGKGGGKGAGKGQPKGASPKVGESPDKVADRPVATPVELAAARTARRPEDAPAGRDRRTPVPSILTATPLRSVPGVIVETALPPAAQPVAEPAGLTALNDQGKPDLARFAFTPVDLTEIDDTAFATTLNSTTNVWDNPIATTPPSAGPVTARARETIGSVLGNAIQDVMVYPINVPIQDPDLISGRPVTLAWLAKTESQAKEEQEVVSETQDFNPSQDDALTPAQETEMNSNDDPRIARLRDERFAFSPPPMVNGQIAPTVTVSGACQTPRQLLSKMQEVVDQTQTFAPPPPPPVMPSASTPQPVCAFSRIENEAQVNFDVQEERIVTVFDFTNELQGQSAQEQPPQNLNRALNSVLRHRGAWAQAQQQAQPQAPDHTPVSSSWWS
ncbi:MAG: hypothetical protein C0507_14735 [Cyanobacteria bacterium PR.3.49]|nr:hypothetical protein [Cyanobacteria bacterium PR.3.49]